LKGNGPEESRAREESTVRALRGGSFPRVGRSGLSSIIVGFGEVRCVSSSLPKFFAGTLDRFVQVGYD